MGTPGAIGEEPAVYAHHVRALRARQRREDDEAIGATLRRGGFRDQTDEREGGERSGRARAPSRELVVDFHAASPLTCRDRQSGGFRVPHFDVKAVGSVHAPSRGGVTHPRCKIGGMTAAAHFDYVTSGARIGLGAHIDYIRRETGFDDPAGDLVLDMLDEQEMRAEKNRLAYYTNIPGGWARERGLFEAAERAEPAPRSHLLEASTADVTAFEFQLKLGTVPAWFRQMTRFLRHAHDEAERAATKSGKPFRHRKVTLAEASADEAYDRLSWFDRQPGVADLIEWKQGRTRRSQHRFVGELPDGLSAQDRHEILSRFCETLGADGWMVVGAIHQPDRHNDRRNFHIHVDGYDRPAAWLEEHGCWDFEHVVRRNGKDTRPLRQNKVRYDAPLAGIMRERFITIVNEVVGERPGVVRYLHGTYADNGIDLTPLEHMGNRAIGLEGRGVITEVGSRNAQRIVADEAAACEKRAIEAEAALVSELALVRGIIAGDHAALAAAERYERLERRLIRRRLQRELAEVVIATARSRADAVVRTLTPTPGCRVTRRAGNADLLAAAHRHLAWVDRHTPTQPERNGVARVDKALAARAAALWRTVEAAVARAGEPQRAETIVYDSRKRAKAAEPAGPSRFDGQKRGRLLAWLRKHATDPELLVIERGMARLGSRVPLSIDTLLTRFAGEPQFQRLLLTEQRRREDRAIRAVGERLPRISSPPPTPLDTELPFSTASSDEAAPSKLSARASILRWQAELRERGWALLASKEASVTRSGDRYIITDMPERERRALLHRDYAAEFERRVGALLDDPQDRQPAGLISPAIRVAADELVIEPSTTKREGGILAQAGDEAPRHGVAPTKARGPAQGSMPIHPDRSSHER